MQEFEIKILNSHSPSDVSEMVDYLYKQPIEGLVSVGLKAPEIKGGDMGAFDDTIKIIVDGLSRPFTKLAEALNKNVEAKNAKIKINKADGTSFEYEGGNVKMLEVFLASSMAN